MNLPHFIGKLVEQAFRNRLSLWFVFCVKLLGQGFGEDIHIGFIGRTSVTRTE